MIEQGQGIEVGGEAFRRFVEALDAPEDRMPTLRRYVRKQSPIPR
jgi:uncharacterized protein (DUF1778 family)